MKYTITPEALNFALSYAPYHVDFSGVRRAKEILQLAQEEQQRMEAPAQKAPGPWPDLRREYKPPVRKRGW